MSQKLSREEIKFRQRLYRQAGFYSGRLDGIWGPKTYKAEFDWNNRFYQIKESFSVGFDPRTETNLHSLLPPVQLLGRSLLQLLEVAGFNARVISGTRSYDEQDRIYSQGRTSPGPIVTYARAGQSNHNFGLAFDIGLFKDDGSYISKDVKPYTEAGKLVKESLLVPQLAVDLAPNLSMVALEWGGDWSGKKADYPHYQLSLPWTTEQVRRKFERGEALI
jgi:peptidoglycan L-alanyl-D-glutamate endopeptidase CwlK